MALLRDEERYGFDLVKALGAVDGMVTSEGTIYPLLSRLRKDGSVSPHLGGVRPERPASALLPTDPQGSQGARSVRGGMAAVPRLRGPLHRRRETVNGTRHREVGEYLRRLQRSMAVPAQRRDDDLAEIEEHIASGLAEFPSPTDADVRNVLERVGDPADIAAEARERFGIKPAKRSWTDPAAIILLLSVGSRSSAGSWGSCCSGSPMRGTRATRSSARSSFPVDSLVRSASGSSLAVCKGGHADPSR